MAINVAKDIKPVSELKARTRDVVQQARTSGRPVIITVKGKPAVVLIDVDEYERQRQALDLAALLAVGEADVSAGRTRSMHTALKDRARGSKISR